MSAVLSFRITFVPPHSPSQISAVSCSSWIPTVALGYRLVSSLCCKRWALNSCSLHPLCHFLRAHTHINCSFFIPEPISHTALAKLGDVSLWLHHQVFSLKKKKEPSWEVGVKWCLDAFERNLCTNKSKSARAGKVCNLNEQEMELN